MSLARFHVFLRPQYSQSSVYCGAAESLDDARQIALSRWKTYPSARRIWIAEDNVISTRNVPAPSDLRFDHLKGTD